MALRENVVTTGSDLPSTGTAQALLGPALADEAVVPRAMLASDDFARVTLHVVSENAYERAQMSRLMFSLGHHAEVYADAMELVHHAPSSGVILAREMEDNRCTSLLRQLTASGNWLPLLGFADQLSIDAVVRGLKAGVLDYVIGATSIANIARKIQSCHAEGAQIMIARQQKTAAKQLVERLSPRENEVLAHLCRGSSNKEIARALTISHRTVEIHRMKMMGKIGAHSGADAVRIYLEARSID